MAMKKNMTPADMEKLRKQLAAYGNMRLDKPVKKVAAKKPTVTGIKKMNEMPARPAKSIISVLPKKKGR